MRAGRRAGRKRAALMASSVAAAALLACGAAAYAATHTGGPGDDDLAGGPEADLLEGMGGHDRLQGLAGGDTLLGGDDGDHLYGGNEAHEASLGGDDELRGGYGNDYVEGSAGADVLGGGPGADTLVDGPDADQAQDALLGGDGDDLISAASVPDSRDEIDCGEGVDEVQADKLDAVAANCEKVDIWDPEAAPPDTDPIVEGDFKFNCEIPKLGTRIGCGPDFYVYRQDVYVKLNHSGGKRVDFYLKRYDAGIDDRLGFASAYPGDPQKHLWRNTTGRTPRVYVNASAPTVVRVYAQGVYRTRSF